MKLGVGDKLNIFYSCFKRYITELYFFSFFFSFSTLYFMVIVDTYNLKINSSLLHLVMHLFSFCSKSLGRLNVISVTYNYLIFSVQVYNR